MFLKPRMRKQQGITLIEFMVALAINVILLLGIIFFFSSIFNFTSRSPKTNTMGEQLANALSVMVNDIRRAGYFANAISDVGNDTNNNPFMSTANNTDISVNASGNCILLTYDANNDGVLPTISNSYDDERYGFRLANNAIQTRPSGASFDCAAPPNAWNNLTDPTKVIVTGLTFVLNTQTVLVGPGADAANTGMIMRSVDITISARSATNPAITQTLSEQVRIRNDKFVP